MTKAERARMNELFALHHERPEYYRSLPELELLKQQEAHEKNIALVAAFMMEGFAANPDYDNVLTESWRHGAVELIQQLTQHAPFAQELYEVECDKRDGSAPGVWVYEVVSPFGEWYRKCIIADASLKKGTTQHTEPPDAELCEAWLRAETEKFFN